MNRLRRSSSTERKLDIAALIALSVVVIGSAMAVGAVHPGVFAAVFLLATSSAAILAIRSGLGREAMLVGVLLALAGYSALQALPLPASWIASLAPRNAGVFAEALRPWRLPGLARHSLSLDPQASWIEAARFASYAGAIVIATRVVRAYGTAVATAVVFASALLLAVATLVHGIVEARAVFGLYEPRYATPRWISPLLNSNNLAGYLNLGFFAGGALLVSRKATPLRVPVVLGVVVILGVSLLCGSRGGILALLLGCAALAVVYRRRLLGLRGIIWLQAAGAAGATALLVAITASAETWRDYTASSSKLALFGWVGRMVREHFWLGVGRGAFESAFPPYRNASIVGTTSNVTFAHAENFALQWAAEWGVPVTVCALVAIAFSFWRRGRRPNGGSFVAAGMSVLLVHNLVDVALEVPAVVLALAAAAGVFFGAEGRDDSTMSPIRSSRVAAALSVAAIMLIGLGAWALARLDTVTEARDRLLALYGASNFKDAKSARLFDDALRAAVLKRPGEPYFHLLGAMAARRGGGEPNRWLSRALERDPTRAETYFILGRVLAERGYVRQGLDAMQHALTQEPNLARKVARAALKISREPALLSRVAPAGEAGCPVLVAISGRLSNVELQPFLKEATALSPRCVELTAQYAASLVTELESRTGGCGSDTTCAEPAEAAIVAAERAGAKPEQCRTLRARLLAVKVGPKEALAFLTGKCPPAAQDLDCTRLLLRFAAKAGQPDEFTTLTKEFLAAACDEPDDCVRAEQLVGDLAAQRGDWVLALAHHERAARQSHGSAAWRRYSEVARKAGAASRASEALKRAERFDQGAPADPPAAAPSQDDDP